MQKNEHFIGTCIDYTYDGLGVVKYDNLVFFVKNLLMNEKAELVCTAVKKNQAYAKVVKLLNRSPDRAEPFCKVYKHCGGCQLQHMSYQAQGVFKQEHVRRTLKNIGKLNVEIEPILQMAFPMNYRNKVQVPVCKQEDGIHLGFYRNHTHEIIEFDYCGIQSEESNQIMNFCRATLGDEDWSKELRHILIKHAFCTDCIMVVLITYKNVASACKAWVEKLCHEFDNIDSVIVNINTRQDNVILGEQEILVKGSPTIVEELEGLRFNISPKSFFQVNPLQTAVLYQKAIEYAAVTKEDVLLDCYCGTGTMGLIASKYCKKVIGIEIVASAIEDAKKNAALNGIENAEFICGDAGEIAERLQEKVSVVLVDPPRKGCDQKSLDAIVKFQAGRIVYVSCNPATLARDLAYLKEQGYEVKKVQPVDLFPNSYHVETVVLLSKLNVKKHINVKLDLDEFDLTSAESIATYQEIKKIYFR